MLMPLMLSSLIGLTSNPPVELATCEVTTPVIQQQGDGSSATVGQYSLHVRFADTAQQPISRVTFTLEDGTSVIDVGTFSPGVTINHALPLESTSAGPCEVTAVEFADGATWQPDVARSTDVKPAWNR
jgi:hypothetical protein